MICGNGIINNVKNSFCFVIAPVELFHRSVALNTLLVKSVVDSQSLLDVLKFYAYTSPNDKNDVDVLNSLVSAFCRKHINEVAYSYKDFISYYVMPILTTRFGVVIMNSVLNELSIDEVFIDRVKYSYTTRIKKLLIHPHEHIVLYEKYLKEYAPKLIIPKHNPIHKYAIKTDGEHCFFDIRK